MLIRRKAMLIVLTGKTASGKDTIAVALLKKYPDLKKVITTTARAIREGEVNGLDYHFLSEQEFREKINNNEFLEHVEYGGNLYGTQKKEFLHEGMVLWKIDPSRAGRVRELISDQLIVIYITASDEVILERLSKRGLSQKEIEQRMADDKRIWEKYKDHYDFVVENITGRLEQTIDKVISIIENHNK